MFADIKRVCLNDGSIYMVTFILLPLLFMDAFEIKGKSRDEKTKVSLVNNIYCYYFKEKNIYTVKYRSIDTFATETAKELFVSLR